MESKKSALFLVFLSFEIKNSMPSIVPIGLIILLKQIPHIFGYDKDPEGDFSFIQVDSQNTFSEILHLSNHISYGPLCISIVSLLILILWEKKSKT